MRHLRLHGLWSPSARITVGSDHLDYYSDVSTETAGLTTAKILFNSVVSTPHAKFMTIDITNMYLNTSLTDFQYMCFHIDAIPQEVVNTYNLGTLAEADGWVYCKIGKAVYGLKESGKLANIQLQKVLSLAGYRPCALTQGLYKHDTRAIVFSFVVDDFDVRYTNNANAEHLKSAPSNMRTLWKQTGRVSII